MNRPTIAKQTKATQTEQTDGKECRKHLCFKTERINAWSQIYRVGYQNTERYCTQGDNVRPRGHDINTISQCYRCANDWIQKKQKQGCTYHPKYQRFYQINFIWKHSSSSSSYTRWSDRWSSIGNIVFDQCCNRFYYLVVDASEPEILL